jgi:UDP:flavonoid glycosyltransferase YjiC (YdhE family)
MPLLSNSSQQPTTQPPDREGPISTWPHWDHDLRGCAGATPNMNGYTSEVPASDPWCGLCPFRCPAQEVTVVRVLILPPPVGPTHLMAMVPLSWAFRAGGHEILVAGPADLASTALEAGLNFAEVGSGTEIQKAFDQALTEDMFPALEWMQSEHADRRRFQIEHYADKHAGYAIDYLADYGRLATAWGADLLMVDLPALIGRLLGGVLDIPVITHRWGVDPTGEVFEAKAKKELDPLCQHHGLSGLPDPLLVIDPCPPSLQWEGARPGRRMRYLPANGAGALSEGTYTPAAGRRICVCPGRSLLRWVGPRPMRRIAEALAEIKDSEVIFALTAADRKRVGILPEWFHVVESVPLNLFLGTCDVFISLGGGGSTLTATALGVPQLVLPQWFDQFDFGRRLSDATAGISISSREGQDDVKGIRKAITVLLDRPAYTEGARRLKAENDSSPPPSALVAVVEDLVVRRASFLSL